jgi:type IV pilus assembly protein PilM
MAPGSAEKKPERAWGLDVGQGGLKALRLHRPWGGLDPVVEDFEFIEYPPIAGQSGADRERLRRKALESFLGRKDVTGCLVAVGLPGPATVLRRNLMGVSADRIAETVVASTRAELPFPLEEAAWDWQQFGGEGLGGPILHELDAGLFALQRQVVDSHLAVFEGLDVGIDLAQSDAVALTNFLADDLDQRQVDEAGAALDVGAEASHLVVADGRRRLGLHTIPLGGHQFTRTIAKQLGLTFAEAERLKRDGERAPEAARVAEALAPVLDDFLGQVQRALDELGRKRIGEVVCLGGGAQLHGLQPFLAERLAL